MIQDVRDKLRNALMPDDGSIRLLSKVIRIFRVSNAVANKLHMKISVLDLFKDMDHNVAGYGL